MNLKHQHIIGICLLLCGLSGFVACTDESPELPRKEEDAPIFLTFQADVAGASTRGAETAADDRVEMLRIVIVSKATEAGTGSNPADAKWEVEHNTCFTSVGPQRPLEYTFKVAADSRKRIYLIANESGLVDTEGTPLDFSDEQFIPDATDKAPVDDHVFAISSPRYPYTPSALPMTALYETDVPSADQITNGEFAWPNPLYLVRAATKLSFEFTNQSTRKAVTVTGIDIQQVITDRMYLMPHVNKNSEDKYWVVEETETDGTPQYASKPLVNQDWVDWMGDEAQKSNEDKDNEWLTDYEVPDNAMPGTATVPFTSLSMPAATGTGPYPSAEASDAIYLPESKTVKAENDPLQLQEYNITVRTKEQATDGTEEKEKTYPPQTLPHLASLFRNTHVVVGIVFTDHDIECEVDVIPYSEVILEPDFGL